MKNYYSFKIFSQHVFLSLVLLLSISSKSFGNDEPDIVQDWVALPEAEYMLDVSYRIIDCHREGNFEIHLHLFNENSEKSDATFKLTIKDQISGESFEHPITNFPLPFGDMQSAECSSENNSKLKIRIPEEYSESNLLIEITYL